MSSNFKLCPTHFFRGTKNFARKPPCAPPLVTGLFHASLKVKLSRIRKRNHFIVQPTRSEHLFSMLYKRFVHIRCQCMPANCGADTHSLALNTFALPSTVPAEFCITFQGTYVFAHIKLYFSYRHLMTWFLYSCVLLTNVIWTETKTQIKDMNDDINNIKTLRSSVKL